MKFIKCNSRDKKVTTLVKVSDRDYDALSQISWYVDNRGYVVHSLPGGDKISMHRLIMDPGPGLVVDHIDGDTTNNQRENLRCCTPQENSRNQTKRAGTSSKYKGVAKSGRRWKAFITVDGKYIHLGCYGNEYEAAKAYDKAALENFGPYARLNLAANAYIPSILSFEETIKEAQAAEAYDMQEAI